MAGKLKLSKYKANDGRVFPIRISSQTELLAFGSQQNAPTVNASTEKEFLRVRSDARDFGIKTRKIGVRWTTIIPAGYDPTAILYIPILTPEIFNAITIGQGGIYRGGSVQVVSLVIERS